MRIFKFCREYLLNNKYKLVFFVIVTIISAAIGMILPYITGKFLDILIAGADNSVIVYLCFTFGGLSIIKILLDYISSNLYIKLLTQGIYELNIKVIKHVQNLSLSYLNKENDVYLNERIHGDSVSLITFCLTTLKGFISNMIMLLVAIIILIKVNLVLGICMLSFLLAYSILYFILKTPLYKSGLRFKESQSNYVSKLYEQLLYFKLIKTFSIRDELNKRVEDVFVSHKKIAISAQKHQFIYSGLDNIIASIAQICIFIIGGIQILNGNFTIGMFAAFSMYFNIMLKATKYFFGLGASYQSAMASYTRIKELLCIKTESCGEIILDDIETIEFSNVCFKYNINKYDNSSNNSKEKTDNVLNDFNAKFTKGKMYVIEGDNGRGKSTFISLMIGLYIDEYDGLIKYNNVSIKNINMIKARKDLIGFADQKPTLISDTIEYNLDVVCNKKSDFVENMEITSKYVSALNLNDFVDDNGFSFKINNKTSNVSGGEQQKIATLRVLYKDPTLMIFDEPTSSLDKKTKMEFIKYLKRIKKDKIIILVTHDSYVKKECDEVINFNML